MIILAIDPGPKESAWVIWDGKDIWAKAKQANKDVLSNIIARSVSPTIHPPLLNKLVVEQIKSYGMSVSDSIFDTVFWSGRFCQGFNGLFERIPRMDIKMHLCHNSRAKDTNITQALIDRFAPDTPNKGKGTKKEPGFFYGFKADIWQAFAVAVTAYDMEKQT